MKNLNRHLSSDGTLNYNKLFIIGNGFDLAMGLKSGYNDFMRYYFNKLISNSSISTGSKSEFSIKYNYFEDPIFAFGISSAVDYPKVLFDDLKNSEDLNFKDFMLNIQTNKNFKLVPKGTFIGDLLNKINKYNWVDIELIYFHHIHLNINDKEKIRQFNGQLDFLKKSLIDYLKLTLEDLDYSQNLKDSMNKVMASELDFKKLKSSSYISHINKSKVGKSYFLNFNYTTLLKDVIFNSYNVGDACEITNIHGTIEGSEGDLEQVVFGYGDEDSKKFKDLLEKNNDDLLENIKTYKYLANENYDSLYNFINSEQIFQVIILGHSCQLSDKVLLKEIFENENCFSIDLFQYKGVKEYMKKTMNISRVTENPKFLRHKVFRFDAKNIIPQSK